MEHVAPMDKTLAQRQRRYRVRRKQFVDKVRAAYANGVRDCHKELIANQRWGLEDAKQLSEAKRQFSDTIEKLIITKLLDDDISNILYAHGHQAAMKIYYEIRTSFEWRERHGKLTNQFHKK